MHLSGNELEAIRREVHREMSDIYRMAQDTIAGSYRYVCCVGGVTMYTHQPVGRVVSEVVPSNVI